MHQKIRRGPYDALLFKNRENMAKVKNIKLERHVEIEQDGQTFPDDFETTLRTTVFLHANRIEKFERSFVGYYKNLEARKKDDHHGGTKTVGNVLVRISCKQRTRSLRPIRKKKKNRNGSCKRRAKKERERMDISSTSAAGTIADMLIAEQREIMKGADNLRDATFVDQAQDNIHALREVQNSVVEKFKFRDTALARMQKQVKKKIQGALSVAEIAVARRLGQEREAV